MTYDYDPVGNRNFVIEDLPGGSSETTTYTYSDFNGAFCRPGRFYSQGQVLAATNSQGTTDYGWDDNGNLVVEGDAAAGRSRSTSTITRTGCSSIVYNNGANKRVQL